MPILICMQYTIRGIPPAVDNALRERARVAGKSLNETAVDALAEGAGMAGAPRKRRDLGDIAGTWKADKGLESALATGPSGRESVAVRVALDTKRYVDLCKGASRRWRSWRKPCDPNDRAVPRAPAEAALRRQRHARH